MWLPHFRQSDVILGKMPDWQVGPGQIAKKIGFLCWSKGLS
jgi:hypothetical protein